MTNNIENHYDSNYFNWQREHGIFGGKINSKIFEKNINFNDKVIDFGCGGGYLLQNINCKYKYGIEPNQHASAIAVESGFQVFKSSQEALDILGENSVDIVISTNVLEHTLHPFNELTNLYKLLKKTGRIHFVVPCDIAFKSYNPNNIDKHLYSWSPQNLANLFAAAGFNIIYVKTRIYKWPPFYKFIYKMGNPIFNLICKLYNMIDISDFEVEIYCEKNI